MIEVPKINESATLKEVIAQYNEMTDKMNKLISNMSLKENFDGQIIENLVFAAGETKVIPHKLGIPPKYRIILRQEGNGVLSDTPSSWNQYQIKMINNGAVQVTATIILLRE